MAVWLVRAGRNGELEEFVVENNQAVIGWDRLSDLSGVESRDELKAMCGDVYAERHPMAIAILVGQLWAFRERMSPRDLVVLPFKTRSGVAIGEVTGSYQYRPESAAGARHTRPVKWLRTDIPRSEFGQDLRYSLNAGMTVCRIKRNNAEERIKAVLAGKPDPGLEDEEVIIEEIPDLEAYAREQIRDFIARSFKEHELAHLVDDILKAQGYKTHLSPPGPDGGVDIIA
ncbi:MAG: restriction endonuclease, partial [Candidatus Brocadiae bacterium]|nr:restriction endonuclease [Candidatus Brocadiia bacterium]